MNTKLEQEKLLSATEIRLLNERLVAQSAASQALIRQLTNQVGSLSLNLEEKTLLISQLIRENQLSAAQINDFVTKLQLTETEKAALQARIAEMIAAGQLPQIEPIEELGFFEKIWLWIKNLFR